MATRRTRTDDLVTNRVEHNGTSKGVERHANKDLVQDGILVEEEEENLRYQEDRGGLYDIVDQRLEIIVTEFKYARHFIPLRNIKIVYIKTLV